MKNYFHIAHSCKGKEKMKRIVVFLCISLVSMSFLLSKGMKENKTSPEDIPVLSEQQNKKMSVGNTASGLPLLTKDTIKIGFIYPEKITNHGFVYSHELGRLALEQEGYATEKRENVANNTDVDKALIDLIEDGCNVIYATSKSYESHIHLLAKQFPQIYFNVMRGEIPEKNVSCYDPLMYEAMYLAGIAAGGITVSNKIGIIAPFPTTGNDLKFLFFTNGVASYNKNAQCFGIYINDWTDDMAEREATNTLIDAGCDIIVNYTRGLGPLQQAEERGVRVIGIGTDDSSFAPQFSLCSALYNFTRIYPLEVSTILAGTWTGTLKNYGLAQGGVGLNTLSLCPEEVKSAIERAKKDMIENKIQLHSSDLNVELKEL